MGSFLSVWFFLSISSVQLLNHVWLFVIPWTTACQASLSITNSQILPKLMFIQLVMPSNHLTLCHPFLLLPSIFPSIRITIILSHQGILSVFSLAISLDSKLWAFPLFIASPLCLFFPPQSIPRCKGILTTFSLTLASGPAYVFHTTDMEFVPKQYYFKITPFKSLALIPIPYVKKCTQLILPFKLSSAVWMIKNFPGSCNPPVYLIPTWNSKFMLWYKWPQHFYIIWEETFLTITKLDVFVRKRIFTI